MRITTLLSIAVLLIASNAFSQPTPLFDEKTFRGWEGDTLKTWRIEEGSIVGGSLTEEVPHNEFLTTTRTFGNFHLRLQFRLEGTQGFINSGVQFHSERIKDPAYEMTGYQADLGDGYWACLYDESRRNKVLACPDSMMIAGLLRKGDWNDYEVIANSGRITIRLNGKTTVDYTEPDKQIPQRGRIALQIHGGGKALVRFRKIDVDERTR